MVHNYFKVIAMESKHGTTLTLNMGGEEGLKGGIFG